MNPLQAGITAAREGRRAEARALLMQALQTNSRSEQGWLWMSAVVETDTERQACLEQVLTINPHNQTAQLGLEKIKAGSSPEGAQPGYLPISRPNTPQHGDYGAPTERPAPPPTSAGPAVPPARPPSPHSLPTLSMSPVEAEAGRIRRLDPLPAPVDGLALLRSAQFQPRPAPAPAAKPPAPSTPGSLAAVILIGGLSVTAIAGLLVLVALWIIGWPPA